MNIVKYVALGNCKVKVGGVEYSGKQVIPVGGDKGLRDKDIERLLKDKFICKLELEEGGEKTTPPKSAPPEKKLEQMNKAELLAKAKELGIEADKKLGEAELRRKIAEEQAKNSLDIKTGREELIAEAAGLGLSAQITDATTSEEIRKLIAAAKAQ